MSLIQYPDGRPMTNDIDFASFYHNYLVLGECKQFVNGKNEIWIDPTKLKMLRLLGNLIEPTHRKIFFVGTDDYSLQKPGDDLWFQTLDSLLSEQVPYETCSGSIVIQKEDMIPGTREGFSALGNGVLKHYGIKSMTFKNER